MFFVSVTSGNSKTTYTYYAGTDRVQTVTSDTSANSSAAVTYTYDTAGKLTEIHRGNTVYTIEYDEWGNQKEIKVGNTALSTNTYEQGNGNLTNTTYGNGTSVDFIYDKLDRLTSKKINDVAQFTQVFNNTGAISKYNDLVTGVSWKYSYDLIGRLVDITGSNGNRYYYIYDSENRISELKYIIGGATRSTNYTYNVLGIPSTVSFAGNTISNSYDDLGRLHKESLATDGGTVLDTDYTYVDISSTQTTNRLHKLTGVTYEFTNTYDTLGNVIRVDEDWVKTSDTYVEFEYDSLGQLVRESGSRGTYTVTYDTKGNILTKGNNTYTYGNSNWGDLLTAYNGTIINYDEIGNPNNWRDGMSFDWQNGRQLASVTKDGKTYSFTYDSSGLRTSKKNDNGTPEDETDDIVTTFTYVDGNLVHQTDGTNVWYFYYDATDKLVSMEYNGEQYYYVYDSIGNIVVLMTYDVLDMANYSYDAWGKIVDISGELRNINPMRYKGYYYDQETGLYYVSSRYYDPEIGRWISPEPNVYNGEFDEGAGLIGYNVYAYCANNPVNYYDPTGEFVISTLLICVAAGAIIGGTIGGIAGNAYANSKGYTGWDKTKSILTGIGIGGLAGGALGYFAAPAVVSATGVAGISITSGGISTIAALGTSFGKLGILIANNGQQIIDWCKTTWHGMQRMIERGVTQNMVEVWAKTGKALQQAGDKILYITKQGAVVIDKAGKVITAYTSQYFDPAMQEVVEKLFGK